MSNHNLFTLSADGAVVPASSETILIAARQVLAHRVRRGASLQSGQGIENWSGRTSKPWNKPVLNFQFQICNLQFAISTQWITSFYQTFSTARPER